MSVPNKCPRLTEMTEGHPELPARSPTPPITRIVRVGSRKSKLALIQANQVIDLLRQAYGQSDSSRVRFEFEMVTMTTKGDQIQDQPLAQIGSKALFTKELEQALLDNQIDLIVHSCKDLPTTLPPGLRIAAILSRENPNDVFVLKKDGCIKFTDEKEFLKRLVEDKSHNWTIGTSSLRRIAQLKHLQPNIQVADIRGNIDTRLKKLDDLQSDYAALVLAAAGLKRAGFGDRINVSLRNNWWHAVGQGAIALECRENDEFIHNLLYPLIHFKTTYEIIAERSFMQYLEGGCSVPLGVKCWFGPTDQQLTTYSNQSSTEPVEREKSVLLPVNGDSNSIKNGKRSLMDDASESIHETHEHIKKIRVDGDSLCPETVCNGNSPESNGSVAKAGVCPVLTAKRVMEHLFDNSRTLIDQQEYESSDLFDCNNISNLSLSGVVYSPDGKRHVRFESSLDEAIRHFDQLPDDQKPKVNCSHVSFPTRACPKLQQVRIDYEHCAQLGVFVAQKLIELGAQGILDELKAVRIPLEAGAEDVSI